MISALCAEPAAPQELMLMKDAPRDGSWVALWAYGLVWRAAFWDVKQEGWWNKSSRQNAMSDCYYIGWLPLPTVKLPEAKAKEERNGN